MICLVAMDPEMKNSLMSSAGEGNFEESYSELSTVFAASDKLAPGRTETR